MIKVLVADDHAIIREGIKQVIKEQLDITLVGEARNGEEALKLARHVDWDVLVMDISMPLRNGMEVLKEIRVSKPCAPVLMLSVYPEDQFGIRVIKAGAAGYLNKAIALNELVAAIKRVTSGGKYISTTLAELFLEELGDNHIKAPHKQLTDREYDVLRMMGAGKRPGEIARELALSVKTISTYRGRVLIKLGLKTNADLIRYVTEHGLA